MKLKTARELGISERYRDEMVRQFYSMLGYELSPEEEEELQDLRDTLVKE